MRNAEALGELKESPPSLEHNSGSVRDADISFRCGCISIHRSHGNGMPVLILNGESSFQDTFTDVIKGSLGVGYNIITMDCSSVYELNTEISKYVVSEFADAALQLIEVFDIDYAAVVGHSIGCLIAVKLAAYFPGTIAIGLSGLPLPHSPNAVSIVDSTPRVQRSSLRDDDVPSASSLQKCYILDNVKEELSVFLKHADELYKETLAGPVLWYGG